MAFVNEKVSEEDVKKYELDGLMRKFNPWSISWRHGRPEVFQHAWTIDRERNIWLARIKGIEEGGPSGRPEPTTKSIFILNWKDQLVQVLLDRAGSSQSHSDSPFVVQWKLIEMMIPETLAISREIVLSVLKEALLAYGDLGIHLQIPGTQVKFNNF